MRKESGRQQQGEEDTPYKKKTTLVHWNMTEQSFTIKISITFFVLRGFFYKFKR